MIEFRGDDAAYMNWIAAHPNAFVLNVRRTPDPNYVVLHRATCGSITAPRERGAYTGRSYRKICAVDVRELRSAARREGREDGSFFASLRTVSSVRASRRQREASTR